MYYYTVNVVEKYHKALGTYISPDIPDGTPFVGNVGSDGEYLIATPTQLLETTKRKQQLPRQALENACNSKGFRYDKVIKWYVNEGGS